MIKASEANIRLQVALSNPGHFLACCGMLELADRVSPSAEGWFDREMFCIRTPITILELVRMMCEACAEEVTVLQSGIAVKPLIAPLRVNFGESAVTMTLDAWMRIGVERGVSIATANPPWNFWSGQQTSLRIWNALRTALQKQLAEIESNHTDGLFECRIPISGRFGFDPGAAWNALDVGFSPNEQKIDVGSSPLVEMFAAVGLQRFRPMMHDRDTFSYSTWGIPLPPAVASSAAAGRIPAPPQSRFTGHVISRGSYGGLAYSNRQKGEDR